MSNTLINGQRINLSNILNDIKKVKIEITYQIKDSYSILGSEFNFLAFCLNENAKFINKYYFVNRINNKTPDNALNYCKSLNNENVISFTIDFTKINSSIKKIIFALSLENDIFNDSDKFKFLKRLEVKLSSLDKITFLKFDVPLNFSNETTIEIFEIYNKDFQWRAVGYFYGYIGNLGLLTEKYGLQLDEENYFDEKHLESSITRKEVRTSNEAVNKKLKIYQEKLLDLSKRNPLINIKPKSIIEFQNPDMYEIFNLIQENKNIIISPIPENFDLYREEANEIIAVKKKKELTSLLYRIKNRASSSMEEQGINILFLSFGLLTWVEKENSQDKFISPIILVPVELIKDSLNSPYKLKLLDDEIIVNPALNTKLNNQYGKQLDDLPEEFTTLSLKDYFEEYNAPIK